jgi:hypothetical protein
MSTPTKIKIVATIESLTQVWDAAWAEKHHGKTYTATVSEGGWAQTDYAKFPPGSFEVIEPSKVKHKLTKIEGHSESSVVKYNYRGVTITGTSNASSSSPYSRSRRWVTSNGGRASSLTDAKSRVDFALDKAQVSL